MEVIIPYKPNKLIMFGVIAFFGVCGILLGNLALAGDTSLLLFRVVRLGPGGASIAFWVMSIICCMCAVGALFLVGYSLFHPKTIVFGDVELQFPKKGFGREYHVINYSDITGVNEVSISGTCIYTVFHSNGKIELATSMVPGKQYYEQFKAELGVRIDG